MYDVQVKAGWFHAPLLGSLGLHTTDGITNYNAPFYEIDGDGQFTFRFQTQDNFKKSISRPGRSSNLKLHSRPGRALGAKSEFFSDLI